MYYRKLYSFKIDFKRNIFNLTQLSNIYLYTLGDDRGRYLLFGYPIMWLAYCYPFNDLIVCISTGIPYFIGCFYIIYKMNGIYAHIRHSRFMFSSKSESSTNYLTYNKSNNDPCNVFLIRNKISLNRFYLEDYFEVKRRGVFSLRDSDNGYFKIVFDSSRNYNINEDNFLNFIIKKEFEDFKIPDIKSIFKRMGNNRFFCFERKYTYSLNEIDAIHNKFSFSNEREFIFVTEYELYYYFNPAPVYVN